MFGTRLIWSLIVLFALHGPLFAEEADPAAVTPKPVKAAEGSAEFAYVATSGNSSTETIGLSGELTVRPLPFVLVTKLAFIRQTTEDELQAKSFTWELRGSREFSERLSGFGQYDYLRNLFAGIEHRHGAETGVSCLVMDGERHHLVLDGGLGYSQELRVESATRTSATALAGANYKLKVSSTTDLVNDMRAIQSLAHGPDWRADNQLSVATKINSIFSLKVGHTLRYVNDPVPGFERTDTVTKVALVAKF